MFTGLVEELGTVVALKRQQQWARITIKAACIMENLALGDSVAVNGVCLTVVSLKDHEFQADIMNETLRRSSLGELTPGKKVNLERAMGADGRFGGHLVSGHIDGTGKITEIRKEGIAVWYRIQAGEAIMKYIIEKGSVAIDGISLTVAKTQREAFWVSVIPHTGTCTNLSGQTRGAVVNLENDMIGKYVEKFCGQKEGLTLNFLKQNGF